MVKRIYFHTGGPYHPTRAQHFEFQRILGSDYEVIPRHGTEIFDDLDNCDLFVASALHWSGMDGVFEATGCWPEGHEPVKYVAPTERQKEDFRQYVRSGKPVLPFHGGIGCYDDWPEYGQLLGVTWDWQVTNHGKYDRWKVTIPDTGHPVVANVEDYEIADEIYVNVQITPGLPYAVHAVAFIEQMRFPMILTAEGGRVPGAGKTAYLANGHDVESLSCEGFRNVIRNTVAWLLT